MLSEVFSKIITLDPYLAGKKQRRKQSFQFSCEKHSVFCVESAWTQNQYVSQLIFISFHYNNEKKPANE